MADLPERRCPYCQRLLFKGRGGTVEIRCEKCRRLWKFDTEPLPDVRVGLIVVSAR